MFQHHSGICQRRGGHQFSSSLHCLSDGKGILGIPVVSTVCPHHLRGQSGANSLCSVPWPPTSGLCLHPRESWIPSFWHVSEGGDAVSTLIQGSPQVRATFPQVCLTAQQESTGQTRLFIWNRTVDGFGFLSQNYKVAAQSHLYHPLSHTLREH